MAHEEVKRRSLPSASMIDTLASTLPEEHLSAEALQALARDRAARRDSETVDAESAGAGVDVPIGAPTVNPSPTTVDELQPPRIERPGLATKLPYRISELLAQSRYILGEPLGSGATGWVFSGLDGNLGRSVAVKFMVPRDRQSPERVANFIREGRVTASLEHPGIVPIYDIDATDSGNVYLVMRKISGQTLHDAIEDVAEGLKPASAFPFNTRVNIVLKLCEALSYSHARGVIHRDVKPGNIILGEHGEVTLVDWGTASSGDGRCPSGRLLGTPAFMAPEQARRERADTRSDVYCVGATLFYLLTFRWPTEAEDIESFWAKKTAGQIDGPTRAERRALPAPLLAIALKALEADPERRYQTMAALASDLSSYQAGLSTSAYRHPLPVRIARFCLRHWAASLTLTLFIAMAASFSWVYYKERQRDIATWGDRPLEGAFADDAWLRRWQVLRGKMEREGASLVTRSSHENLMAFTERVQGNVAVEYEAEMRPDHPSDHISLLLLPSLDETDRNSGWQFLLGAQYNTSCCIVHRDLVLAACPMQLVPNRRYHVRVELVESGASLYLDGRLLLSHQRRTGFRGGYVTLFGFHPGKAFSGVRIFSRGVPQRISSLESADAFFELGHFGEALERYEGLIESHGDTPLSEWATVQKARCLHELGRREAALSLLRDMKPGASMEAVNRCRIEFLAAEGCHKEAADLFRTVFVAGNPTVQQVLRSLWSRLTAEAAGRMDREAVLLYGRLRRELFVEDLATAYNVCNAYASIGAPPSLTLEETPDVVIHRARVLGELGRHEEVVRIYPHFRVQAAASLLALGRYRDVLAQYPDQEHECEVALRSLGLPPAEVLSVFPQHRGALARMLFSDGRSNEVLSLLPDQSESCAQALVSMGRYQEALERYPKERVAVAKRLLERGDLEVLLERCDDQADACITALFRSGRYAEILRRYPESRTAPDALMGLGRYEELSKTGASRVAARADLFLRNYRRVYANCALSSDEVAVAQICEGGGVALQDVLHGLSAWRFTGQIPTFAVSSQEARPPTVPEPWKTQSIGIPFMPPVSMATDSYLVVGAAGRPWEAGYGDDASFLCQPCRSDFVLTARLDAVRLERGVEAGVMVREDDAPAARMSSLGRNPRVGLIVFKRTQRGGQAQRIPGPKAVGLPNWLRVARRGRQVELLSSTDGTHWEQVGQQWLSSASALFAGVYVRSADPGVYGLGIFSHVTLQSTVAP